MSGMHITILITKLIAQLKHFQIICLLFSLQKVSLAIVHTFLNFFDVYILKQRVVFM